MCFLFFISLPQTNQRILTKNCEGEKMFFFFFFCSLKLFKLYAELSGTVWSERKCTLTMLSDDITSIHTHTCWWFRGHGIVSAGFDSCSCSTKVKPKQRLTSLNFIPTLWALTLQISPLCRLESSRAEAIAQNVRIKAKSGMGTF